MMNFSYVVPGVLAAGARPRSFPQGGDDLQSLKNAGLKGVVSLTESPLPPESLRRAGLEYLHIPIEDFGTPRVDDIERFIAFVRHVSRRAGGPVLVHCGSGYGRTGTMAACFLVSEGQSAVAAIREVRQLRPGSIETEGQEAAVGEWQRRCEAASRAGGPA
jgi:atypical dual specificity phosphatase